MRFLFYRDICLSANLLYFLLPQYLTPYYFRLRFMPHFLRKRYIFPMCTICNLSWSDSPQIATARFLPVKVRLRLIPCCLPWRNIFRWLCYFSTKIYFFLNGVSRFFSDRLYSKDYFPAQKLSRLRDNVKGHYPRRILWMPFISRLRKNISDNLSISVLHV